MSELDSDTDGAPVHLHAPSVLQPSRLTGIAFGITVVNAQERPHCQSRNLFKPVAIDAAVSRWVFSGMYLDETSWLTQMSLRIAYELRRGTRYSNNSHRVIDV